ncbi:MAG: gamma-glutamyl-gamma-aminobutyrate hydrolase family protein [Thermoanaerobaculum sp.]
MRVFLVHSDDRPFEMERFGAAWEAAGGAREELVPVTPTTREEVLKRASSICGVLTTGGPDVDPGRYGAPHHPLTAPNPEREALDWALLERAAQEELPVLAVCFGCQLLNVFYGGTLIQHLPDVGKEGHRISNPKDHIAHPVRIAPGSRLLLGFPQEFGVNSRHHQALDRIGTGLRVVATAPDGVVEAVEVEDGRFVLGVQWHPENLLFEPHLELFRRFRQACLQRLSR